MKTLVYGGGAVGLGIASCLLKSGISTDIVARPGAVTVLKEKGLSRKGIFGSFSASPREFRAYTSIDSAREKPDVVLVCTKSFDSQEVASDLNRFLKPRAWRGSIILFQNGWGNAEQFLRFFDDIQVLCARVITGFTRTHPNEVEITVHAEAIRIGWPREVEPTSKENALLGSLCTAITKGGIPCERTDNIVAELWAKMLYNCALNGLGALFEATYGELAVHEESRALMSAMVKEIFEVMKGAGFNTHWPGAGDFLETFYSDLIPPTQEHYSSTLQDIRAGKQTEIEALNGAVYALGKEFGVTTPVNETVYRMVKLKAREN